MLTNKQEGWFAHLPSDNSVKIVPYDPKVKMIFYKVKAKIIAVLGKGTRVVHRGASSLKISGQDEIDCYVPTSPKLFFRSVEKLKKVFGEPGSVYSLERARFNVFIDGKKIEVFIINKEHEGWINMEIFGLSFKYCVPIWSFSLYQSSKPTSTIAE